MRYTGWRGRSSAGYQPQALALIGWTTSGAVAILFLRPYMGYHDRIHRADRCAGVGVPRDAYGTTPGPTAGFAGFAAGSRYRTSIFGTVALLALIAPTLVPQAGAAPVVAAARRRRVLEVSPWLLFMAQNGWPASATPVVEATYAERVTRFVTELLPRAFGLRTELGGDWVGPDAVAVGVAALLIIGSIVGMVLLVIRKGLQACRSW